MQNALQNKAFQATGVRPYFPQISSKWDFEQKNHCFDTSATCPGFVRWLQEETKAKPHTFQSGKLSLVPRAIQSLCARAFLSTDP